MLTHAGKNNANNLVETFQAKFNFDILFVHYERPVDQGDSIVSFMRFPACHGCVWLMCSLILAEMDECD